MFYQPPHLPDSRCRELLHFWFGDLPSPAYFPGQRAGKWFEADDEFNREIARRFGALHQEAAEGHLDDWGMSPGGLLGLIILLDQFSRNLFTDARAFRWDEKSLRLAEAAVDKGWDRQCFALPRAFLYMPFEHAEDLAMQEKSVRCFEQLRKDAPAEIEFYIANMSDYAQRHYEIICRFGRFPHRNQMLGRETSAEEARFLKEPGSSF